MSLQLTKDELAKLKPTANKDVAWLQKWINEFNPNANLVVDGFGGTLTKAAFISTFVNRLASAITEEDLLNIAKKLGDTNTKRIKAVSKVESGGSGWFKSGLPKILYERHKFHLHTKGKYSTSNISNKTPGGYTEDANKNGINDSWEKLAEACMLDPLAALKSISIGKFQVLGEYYTQCGYPHPIYMLWAARNTELAHYWMLRDYILKVANLKSAFLKLSTNAESCRAFARGYNGIGYEKYSYHIKLANAMK